MLVKKVCGIAVVLACASEPVRGQNQVSFDLGSYQEEIRNLYNEVCPTTLEDREKTECSQRNAERISYLACQEPFAADVQQRLACYDNAAKFNRIRFKQDVNRLAFE